MRRAYSSGTDSPSIMGIMNGHPAELVHGVGVALVQVRPEAAALFKFQVLGYADYRTHKPHTVPFLAGTRKLLHVPLLVKEKNTKESGTA